MAQTPSQMVNLGTVAPDFKLWEPAHERWVSRDQVATAQGLLVVFMCNHCPYVIHIRPTLATLMRQWQQEGLGVVAIAANDEHTHPQDGPAAMTQLVRQGGWPETIAYVFDSTQEVAHAYGAACTPDFFLYDREQRLYYRGQFDGARPGSTVPCTGVDLAGAIAALRRGEPPPVLQKPSLGCNIKWKET